LPSRQAVVILFSASKPRVDPGTVVSWVWLPRVSWVNGGVGVSWLSALVVTCRSIAAASYAWALF